MAELSSENSAHFLSGWRRVLMFWPLSAAAGVLLAKGLALFLPTRGPIPHCAIAGSFVLDLAGLSLLLSLLFCAAKCSRAWPLLRAWLGTVFVMAPAYAGLALSSAHLESPHVFVVLFGLFAAQAAALSAVHGVLSVLLWWAPRATGPLTALALGLLVTALFWSRAPLQRMVNERGGASATALMKVSPPLAVASVWQQECDAARAPEKNQARFDLIRGPLTYEVWMGSYMAIPYPAITPNFSGGERTPGLIVQFLLVALPLLLVCDFLARRTTAAMQ